MRRLVLFEDGLGRLGPLTDLRPACLVRTGALTLVERAPRVLDASLAGVLVFDALGPLVREILPGVPVNPGVEGPVLALNGRCPLPPAAARSLRPGEVLVEAGTGEPVALVAPMEGVGRAARGDLDGLRVTGDVPAPALLRRPWHTRTFRDAALSLDLALLAPERRREPAPAGVTILGDHPVAIDPSARVMPGCILDAERGPVAIGAGALVRPACTLIGPVALGAHATVLDRALVKGGTALGPHAKIAGEVGGTIFQGYANKAHDGHLGDSWIGEWVNLGAGTTNSNLLNTYDEVTARAEPDAPIERTGERFLGCVLGDHVKTAIGTRVMTGAVAHTGVMWAATTPLAGCVGRFAWCTDGGPARRFRLDKFVAVAGAMMARRSVTPGAAYLARLAALHAPEAS